MPGKPLGFKSWARGVQVGHATVCGMDERVVPRRAEDGGALGLTTLLLRRMPAGSAGRALDLLAAGGASPGVDPGAADQCVYALVDMASDDPDEPLAAVVVVGPDAGGGAELRALAVSPAYIGSRLGGRIVTAVVDQLRTTGARRVLAAPGHHVDVERIYRQVGFRPVATGPHALDSWYELEL